MPIPLLGSALGLVGDLAGSWLKGKVDKQKAESEVKVARAKAEATVYEKQATGELDMEKSLTEQMGGSWKDEAWTIFFYRSIIRVFFALDTRHSKRRFYILR